jgi:hypothetical protein
VKRQLSRTARVSNSLVRAPGFPWSGIQLFRRLAGAVSAARGRPLRNAEVANLTGAPETTMSYWFHGHRHENLLAWCRLLEHLSREQRQSFLDSICRGLPDLGHPQLAHNPGTVAQLRRLLEKPVGLTLVGGADPDRTFLVAALGHAFCRLHIRGPSGLDAHEPSWFVPVPGVQYLPPPLHGKKLQAALQAIWQQVRDSQSSLLILNSVYWTSSPKLRRDYLATAARKHVILAEEHSGKLLGAALPLGDPLHIVSVGPASGADGRLEVRVQAR